VNILEVSQNLDLRGGSDAMFLKSVELLRRAGHEVRTFAARPTGEHAAAGGFEQLPDASHFERPHPGNVWKFLYSPEARRAMDRLLAAAPADVAHFHIYYGRLTASIIAPVRRRDIPIVHHLHDFRSYCSVYTSMRAGRTCLDCRVGSYLPGLANRCNRGSLARSLMSTAEMYVADRLGRLSEVAAFVAVSEFQGARLIAQGLDANRLRVLPNPVDRRFLEAPQCQGDSMLFVGRVETYKGIYQFLDAARALPEVGFVVAGDGGERRRAMRYAKEHGIANVSFLGSRSQDQVVALMRDARAVVVPSVWEEPFGLTAAEAMAAGVAVVASASGGLEEVVSDGEAGYLVPAGDADALGERLRQLAGDAALAARLGQRGKAIARERFSEDSYVERLVGIFHDVR